MLLFASFQSSITVCGSQCGPGHSSGGGWLCAGAACSTKKPISNSGSFICQTMSLTWWELDGAAPLRVFTPGQDRAAGQPSVGVAE